MDCSPPFPSVHGISQARILEWVAISFSRGSFQPGDWNCLLYCQAGSLPLSPPIQNKKFKKRKDILKKNILNKWGWSFEPVRWVFAWGGQGSKWLSLWAPCLRSWVFMNRLTSKFTPLGFLVPSLSLFCFVYFLLTLILFYFIYWPRHTACSILVPQPGTEPGSESADARHWTSKELPCCFFK